MIKCSMSIACWMTGQAGTAFIDVTIHAVVLIVGLWVCMTGDTGERCSCWVRVTVRTLIPYTFMCTTIDREILIIMLCIFCR